jgi:hypothetical protein
LGCYLEISTNDRLAEDLLESSLKFLLVLNLLDQGEGIIGFGDIRVLAFQPVERHECDSTCFLLIEDFKDLGGSLIVVDHDVEETIPGSDFNRCAVLVRDSYKFC